MWILISFLLVLLAGTIILWPYLRPQTVGAMQTATVDPQLAELYIQRDMLYQAIRDARFDLQTGKLSQEDYDQQSTLLKQNAAAVLQSIDELETNMAPPEVDAQIEAAVAAAREMPEPLKKTTSNGGEVKRAGTTHRFCGQCGASLRANDGFCGKCGEPMRG